MTTKYSLYNSVYRSVSELSSFNVDNFVYESATRSVTRSVYSGVNRAISWSTPPFPAVYSAIIDSVLLKIKTL